MAASKMIVLAGAMIVLGVFAHGTPDVAPYSAGARTETADVQELGSITSDGSLVYSMNVCTVVYSTACETTLSTGGAAPEPTEVATSAAEAGETSAGDPATSPYETIPTGASDVASGASTEHEHWPDATTTGGAVTSAPTDAASASGSEDATPTATEHGEHSHSHAESGSATSTGAAPSSSTGAAAAVDTLPGAVLGAAGMAVAYLL